MAPEPEPIRTDLTNLIPEPAEDPKLEFSPVLIDISEITAELHQINKTLRAIQAIMRETGRRR